MKIAVACEENQVSAHFGHCENFAVYDVEDKEVKNKEVLPNPGHKPGVLPKFLHEQGANIVIVGGIGSRAVTLFEEQGIKVVSGIAGKDDDVVANWLDGTLESSDISCNH